MVMCPIPALVRESEDKGRAAATKQSPDNNHSLASLGVDYATPLHPLDLGVVA